MSTPDEIKYVTKTMRCTDEQWQAISDFMVTIKKYRAGTKAAIIVDALKEYHNNFIKEELEKLEKKLK